jgi:hypothetical protein
MRHLVRLLGTLSNTNGDNRPDWPGHRRHFYKARLQRGLNRFLLTAEITSMKDNLVSETVVAKPPLEPTGVLANGGRKAVSLGPCRLIPFRLFLSTSIAVGGGTVDAYDWIGHGSPGPLSPTSVGGGTMVG